MLMYARHSPREASLLSHIGRFQTEETIRETVAALLAE